MSKAFQKTNRKEVRKPVAEKFAPKRLAINFDPPTIIMEYLAVDTGKLYHHKMRLDSILKRSPNRIDILNYVKNKHYLYFVNGKIKDGQILKFIDKILTRTGKSKSLLAQINENLPPPKRNIAEEDDFDYLNDEEYEEDYEDYEEPEDKPEPTKPALTSKINQYLSNPKDKDKDIATFLTKPSLPKKVQQQKDDGGFQWDLQMDDDADFV